MTYKDMCFCKPKGGPCLNLKCRRHYKQVTWGKLPEWELVSISDFSHKCKEYVKGESSE